MSALSPVLANECRERWQSGGHAQIVHEEFDAATVGRMIQFAYLDKYEISPAKPQEEELKGEGEELAPTEHDYYQTDALRSHAITQFTNLLKAEIRSCDAVTLLEVATEISRLPADELRAVLVQQIATHVQHIVQDADFIAALKACEGLQDFTADILAVTAQLQQQGIEELERAVAQAQSEMRRQRLQSAALHEGLESLANDIRSLPSTCPNDGCKTRFGKFQVERTWNGGCVLRCGHNLDRPRDREVCRTRLSRR
ncbi:hypothetical protein B0A48_14099 [Cryoendolithus antarcticus]|uniref:BTB domain-containing protein n=1 Tax=Cryoendolithus antarcticus TaxID=1507870 RepID=A0A1V8SL56_9PEZI|nr:hypothetical protein B0A48_14099 [Cryoendolithus antarcticus]